MNILQNIENSAPKPEINILLNALSKSADDFRELVAHPGEELRYDLIEKGPESNKLCSAMDLIDDIIMAFHSYLKHEDEDWGSIYIYIFGVLQALYIQYTAVEQIGKIVYKFCQKQKYEIIKMYPALEEVNSIRTGLAGHPVISEGGRSHFISRHNLSSKEFEYLVFNQSNKCKTSKVNICKLIETQVPILTLALNDFINLLTERVKDHRNKFKHQKLFDIFEGCDHAIQKLSADRSKDSGTDHLEIIENAIQEFIEKLNTRHPVYTKSDFFKHRMARLERAIERLKTYFDSEPSTTNVDAEIWTDCIQNTVNEFKEWAKEIDNEYSGIKEEQKPQPTGPVTITINGVDFFKNNLTPA